MRLKKIDIAFIVLFGLITLISLDLIFNESHRELIENISKYPVFQDISSGLLITFLICLIGNLLPFPTPYIFVVCFSSLPFLSLNIMIPLLVAFIASLGCMVGEMGGYLVGRGASEVISEERRINLKKYQVFLIEHPKIAPFMIFIAALTPINDDFITIPLGLIKYSFKKTIFWCWLGKLGLMLIFAYNLINLCSFLGGESWLLSIISLYFMLVFIYLIIKINIIEFLQKFVNRNKNKD